MNTQRSEARDALGLTQTEAARRAKVSLATWRRWEENSKNVAAETAAKCARVLETKPEPPPAWMSNITDAWKDSTILTPRQAMALCYTLDGWGDGPITCWLESPDEALHEVAPFAYFDTRVMMLVNENRAWAAKAKERCFAIAKEIESGRLPFDREGCYFDEVLMRMALYEAKDRLNDEPDLFEGIPDRTSDPENDEADLGDDDWDCALDSFDDAAQWDDWGVPFIDDSPLLGFILMERHPFRWFDPVGPRPLMRDTVARARQTLGLTPHEEEPDPRNN